MNSADCGKLVNASIEHEIAVSVSNCEKCNIDLSAFSSAIIDLNSCVFSDFCEIKYSV